MQKYFIIKEGTRLYKDYMEYSKERELVHKLAKEFIKKHNIESGEYGVFSRKFYIVPTNGDMKRFNKLLMKPKSNGLMGFRDNSLLAKDWTKSLDDNGLKDIIGRPHIGLYFKFITGKYNTRIFNVEDNVYCSISVAEGVNIEPEEEGFIEIKASEFYKIIEDEEEIKFYPKEAPGGERVNNV